MMSYEGSVYGNLPVIASIDGVSCRKVTCWLLRRLMVFLVGTAQGALKLARNENPKKTRLQTLELLVKKKHK